MFIDWYLNEAQKGACHLQPILKEKGLEVNTFGHGVLSLSLSSSEVVPGDSVAASSSFRYFLVVSKIP